LLVARYIYFSKRLLLTAIFTLFYRKAEQNENPKAVLQAIKYYNYSIKKKPTEATFFKPLVTAKVIEEESEEIEKFLGTYFGNNSTICYHGMVKISKILTAYTLCKQPW
jgi:hypothetical protein